MSEIMSEEMRKAAESVAGLEPMELRGQPTDEVVLLTSIAISLKRIADGLHVHVPPPFSFDVLVGKK